MYGNYFPNNTAHVVTILQVDRRTDGRTDGQIARAVCIGRRELTLVIYQALWSPCGRGIANHRSSLSRVCGSGFIALIDVADWVSLIELTACTAEHSARWIGSDRLDLGLDQLSVRLVCVLRPWMHAIPATPSSDDKLRSHYFILDNSIHPLN